MESTCLFERYREGHSNICGVERTPNYAFNRKPTSTASLTNGPLDFTAPSPSP